MPGRIGLTLSPHTLSILASQLREGCILITGTNGKTTTANLLASILTRAGKKIIHNGSGANLISGVTTPFIAKSSWSGTINADLGILEVDEAFMPVVASHLRVKAALVTNLFPDQLDRYGDPEHVLDLIVQGLDEVEREGFILLNADDPLVSSIRKDLCTLYFGMDGLKTGRDPRCPRPHYSIVSYHRKPGKATAIAVKTPGSLFHASLKIPGFYNLYNALAAISCALVLGVNVDLIRESLRQFTVNFGRREVLSVEDKIVELTLIKNSAGANEVLRALIEEDIGEGEKILMLVINDSYADGADISWLWDVDFEAFVHRDKKIAKVICSGSRGEESSLRLKYAGIDTRIIKYEADMRKALREGLSSLPAGGRLQVLLSYTALQGFRRMVNQFNPQKQNSEHPGFK